MKNDWDDVRPDETEYGEFYHGYVRKIGTGNIIDILMNQMQETYTLINSLTPDESAYRYEEGKWTPKEIFGHMIDSERVFSYRALAFSRGDSNELPGFDQDAYVENANFNDRSLQNLGNEYFALRNSNVHLFSSFTKTVMDREGIANKAKMTVRSIPFIIAGHERHHLDILHSRYKLRGFKKIS